jgi:hypothetical protein
MLARHAGLDTRRRNDSEQSRGVMFGITHSGVVSSICPVNTHRLSNFHPHKPLLAWYRTRSNARGRDGAPTAAIPEKAAERSVVPPDLARHQIAVTKFARGAVMQQAVPSRLVHPYHHVQTLQASWPRVWTERAFHIFVLGLPGFLVSRTGRLPEFVIRSMS